MTVQGRSRFTLLGRDSLKCDILERCTNQHDIVPLEIKPVRAGITLILGMGWPKATEWEGSETG